MITILQVFLRSYSPRPNINSILDKYYWKDECNNYLICWLSKGWLSGNQPYPSYIKMGIIMLPISYGKGKDKNIILVNIIIANTDYVLNRLLI